MRSINVSIKDSFFSSLNKAHERGGLGRDIFSANRHVNHSLTCRSDSIRCLFLRNASNLMLNTYSLCLSARRTKVIDDESDYFATDSKWLSKKERKILKDKQDKLQQLKHGSRRDKKITLDFAGRKVIEEKATDEINGKENRI